MPLPPPYGLVDDVRSWRRRLESTAGRLVLDGRYDQIPLLRDADATLEQLEVDLAMQRAHLEGKIPLLRAPPLGVGARRR